MERFVLSHGKRTVVGTHDDVGGSDEHRVAGTRTQETASAAGPSGMKRRVPCGWLAPKDDFTMMARVRLEQPARLAGAGHLHLSSAERGAYVIPLSLSQRWVKMISELKPALFHSLAY